MADSDTSDRASRFDRADFGARPVTRQRQISQRLLQALESEKEPPEADPADDDPSSPEDTNADQKPTGDELLAVEHLKGAGWSQAEIETILSGPDHPDAPGTGRAASQAQVEAHLRSLGWTDSDIARLLVGPEKSHLTAEAVYRQHAANPAEDQQALVKAMARAGAQKVQTDPSLLSGLDTAHLGAGTPTDVDQIIAQFADLPDVQKRRFLMLLESQKGDKAKTAKPEGSSSKKQESGNDVLPIVKGGLDLLSTTLKGLLGSSKGDAKKKDKGGAGKGSTSKSDENQDDTDTSDSDDDGDSRDNSDETTDDSDTTSEGGDSSSPDEIDLGDSEIGID